MGYNYLLDIYTPIKDFNRLIDVKPHKGAYCMRIFSIFLISYELWFVYLSIFLCVIPACAIPHLNYTHTIHTVLLLYPYMSFACILYRYMCLNDCVHPLCSVYRPFIISRESFFLNSCVLLCFR